MSMLISLEPILDDVGGHLTREVSVDIPNFERRGSPVSVNKGDVLTVNVSNLGNEWLVKAEGAVAVVTPCDRCLKDTEVSVEIEFSVQLPRRRGSGSHLREQSDDAGMGDDGALPEVDEEGNLDITARVREETILGLPTKILCKPDCRGLCPQCGQDLNEGSCDCAQRDIDPRLMVLSELKDEMESQKHG